MGCCRGIIAAIEGKRYSDFARVVQQTRCGVGKAQRHNSCNGHGAEGRRFPADPAAQPGSRRHRSGVHGRRSSIMMLLQRTS